MDRSRSRSPSRGRSRTRSVSPPRGGRSFSPRSRTRSISRSRSRTHSPSLRSRSPTRSRSRSVGSRRSYTKSPSPGFQSSKIVIEKLTKNVTEAHISEIFSAYGDIKTVDMPVNRQFFTNRGLCYLVYNSPSSAQAYFRAAPQSLRLLARRPVAVPVAIASVLLLPHAAAGVPPSLPLLLAHSRAVVTPTGAPQLETPTDLDLDLDRQRTPAGAGAGAPREAALEAPIGDAAATAGEQGVAEEVVVVVVVVVGIIVHHLGRVGDILVAAAAEEGQQEGEEVQATARTAPEVTPAAEAREDDAAGAGALGLGVEAEGDARRGANL
ncbi:uncharacterized protein H6S33_000716 [Morchella sextelata]|uniref:uncharacterized protein n=1 Tax=Morchella sextelata TaxID=1174677 RepID=UPI001D040A97|nr:uncharacterized protein H6S33_000716 [Morchella sextelata]KAH0615080.1 hypothetical protein H6S33_000716 [Morchella sextelata]